MDEILFETMKRVKREMPEYGNISVKYYVHENNIERVDFQRTDISLTKKRERVLNDNRDKNR